MIDVCLWLCVVFLRYMMTIVPEENNNYVCHVRQTTTHYNLKPLQSVRANQLPVRCARSIKLTMVLKLNLMSLATFTVLQQCYYHKVFFLYLHRPFVPPGLSPP